MKKLQEIIPQKFFLIIFFVLMFIFSCWLMFSTFSYQNGNILVASKAWSDFGSHIPLIRSFSFGWNFPPEYPLFANEPIHYHFLFYAFVGFLERIGAPLDVALNAPSALLFFTLLVMLYVFAKTLFKSKFVGILSILFFVFNGSLSFLYFFNETPFNINLFYRIISSTNFVSFNPYYGESLVSAFWNLNIYTNQRHLAGAFAFSLFVIFLFLRPVLKDKNSESILVSILLGLFLGLSFYFHLAAFGMTAVVVFILSILFPKIRNSGIIILVMASFLAYPQYKYMNQEQSAFGLLYKFGYLTPSPTTFASFVNYWTLNLGLHILLIPIGFILSSKKTKKIFIAFFAFFVIGNIFQFSPEMAANHKFFNYFMLIGGMFSAYVVYSLWKKSFFLKPVALMLTFFLILSGIIDIFPIYNDTKVILADYPQNPDVLWIMKNTPPDAIFLNTSYFIPPESLAGRKIFLGWPYFAWSQGYDTTARSDQINSILQSNNKHLICNFLTENNIHGITLTKQNEDLPHSKEWFSKNFESAYEGSNTTIIYVKDNC